MASDFQTELLSVTKMWRDFEYDLIHKNRFFSKNEKILSKIQTIAETTAVSINEGNVFFRAREYEVYNIFRYDDDFYKDSIIDDEKLYSLLLYAASTSDSNFLIAPVFSEIIEKKRSSMEWGYSKKESGMPPKDKAGVNRANPKYIPYMYLANNIDTALAEVRAQVEQPISVASYEIVNTISVVDFSLAKQYLENENSTIEDLWICINIEKAFSSPARSNDKDYIVSQYIAEYIKTMNFDGIAFNSARNRGGVNYTLFNDSSCKFLGSEIYEVTDIKFKSKRLLPPLTKELNP